MELIANLSVNPRKADQVRALHLILARGVNKCEYVSVGALPQCQPAQGRPGEGHSPDPS